MVSRATKWWIVLILQLTLLRSTFLDVVTLAAMHSQSLAKKCKRQHDRRKLAIMSAPPSCLNWAPGKPCDRICWQEHLLPAVRCEQLHSISIPTRTEGDTALANHPETLRRAVVKAINNVQRQSC